MPLIVVYDGAERKMDAPFSEAKLDCLCKYQFSNVIERQLLHAVVILDVEVGSQDTYAAYIRWSKIYTRYQINTAWQNCWFYYKVDARRTTPRHLKSVTVY